MAQTKTYTVNGDGPNKMRTVTFAVGERVQIHPATDIWMSGDRFGEIKTLGTHYLHVKMDRSGKLRRIAPWHIGERA